MKVVPTLVLLLSAVSAQAQDLPLAPQKVWASDQRWWVTLGPLVREHIDANTPIPKGMVWMEQSGIWYAQPEGSCNNCEKPMTFRQAAFDKKTVVMMGIHLGLGIGDVLAIHRCNFTGYCHEGVAPFFGDGSIKKQMALKMSLSALTWIGTAYIRKGDKSRHIGGSKSWWQLPVVSDAVSTAAIIGNFFHQHSL